MTHETTTRTRDLSQTSSTYPTGLLKRKCACVQYAAAGEECEECKGEQIARQRSSLGSHNAGNESEGRVPPIVYEVLNSPGQPLDVETRSFFEPRFGQDFSHVRVHTDAKAAKSARSVSALAYTVGQNIVFGFGQHAPETFDGRRLLAHELTHTLQQRVEKSSTSKSPVSAAYEHEAEKIAQSSLHRTQLDVPKISTGIFLARKPDDTEKEPDPRYLILQETHAYAEREVGDVSQKLIDRLIGKYANIDGDPGEGFSPTPYLAPEGQCTVGYGHVIYPKTRCKPSSVNPKACVCEPPITVNEEEALRILKMDIKGKIDWMKQNVHVGLNQEEFDALVDLALHVGSIPKDFLKYLHENWYKDKKAVRDRYLKTAVTMTDKTTGNKIVMKNFVERRKRRVWS